MTNESNTHFSQSLSYLKISTDIGDPRELDFWMNLYDVIFYKNRDIYYATLSHIVKNTFAIGVELKERFLTKNPAFDVVQFWDTRPIPKDVDVFMKTWKDKYQSRYKLFDRRTAERFIQHNFDAVYVESFRKCWHPAMESDFFRLCYLYVKGGCYIDADEKFANPIPDIKMDSDPFIMLQPFMRGWDNGKFDTIYLENYVNNYDRFRGSEVYFNNAPIIASQRNPIIQLSLLRAVYLINKKESRDMSVHDITGPSNLSNSLVIHFLRCGVVGESPSRVIAFDWPYYAHTGGEDELSYKSGSGNWRS